MNRLGMFVNAIPGSRMETKNLFSLMLERIASNTLTLHKRTRLFESRSTRKMKDFSLLWWCKRRSFERRGDSLMDTARFATP